MSSKAFIYLGLLLALFLLISSEVAAKDLADKNADSNGVNDAKYGGNNGGDYPGRGSGGRGGGGRYDPPRGGRRCYHGCCRLNRYGPGCDRCCSYAGEAVDAQAETKPHN